MKRGLISGIILVILIIFISLYYYLPKNDLSENTPVFELHNCSRSSLNYSGGCPSGYVCFEHLSGGLTAEGPIPVEGFGGDKKCHKECFLDQDCPNETPFCLLKRITTEDTVGGEHLCFSEEEGKIEREQLYNNCLEINPDISLKNEISISFYRSTYDEIKQLIESYDIEIIRRGGIGANNYIVKPPHENPAEKICKLKLDNRIR